MVNHLFDIYYLQFTFSFQELGVLSLNAYFHIWDVETFSPVSISVYRGFGNVMSL
jgi:hypothetical protein